MQPATNTRAQRSGDVLYVCRMKCDIFGHFGRPLSALAWGYTASGERKIPIGLPALALAAGDRATSCVDGLWLESAHRFASCLPALDGGISCGLPCQPCRREPESRPLAMNAAARAKPAP